MKFIAKIIETYKKGKLYSALLKKDRKIMRVNRNLIKEVNDLKLTNEKLTKELIKLLKESELDKYLKKNASLMRNIAYKEKRYFKDKPISIYLNELIQRDSYEVLKLKKKINTSGTILKRAKAIGTKTSRLFLWTDDKELIKTGDYYMQPNETIVFKKDDCEGHAFVNASLDVELGVAYGFMTINEEEFGHAWNVFVYKDKLYYLETTGNTGKIILASKAKQYDCRFIVTKDHTYRLGPHINFGKLAEYI